MGMFGKNSRDRDRRSHNESESDAGSYNSGRRNTRKASRPPSQPKKQQVLTVAQLRELKQKQLEKGDASVDDLHSIAKNEVISVLKSTLEDSSSLLTKEVQAYLKAQSKVKREAGCSGSKPGRSVKGKFDDLYKTRNNAARAAVKSLAPVSNKDAGKMVASVKSVVLNIKEAFKIKLVKSMKYRMKYYSFIVVKDGDGSPEQIFEGFVALYVCISLFESKTKKQWTDAAQGDLYGLFTELAFILTERFEQGPSSCNEMRSQAEKAFKTIERGEPRWDSSGLQKAYGIMQSSFHQFYAAKVDMEIAKIKNPRGGHKKEQDELDRCATKLDNDQKSYFKVSSDGWKFVNNYFPEMFHELAPTVLHHCELILQTIDVGEDYRDVIKLFTNRKLFDYENIVYLQADLIQCTFKQERTLLKRFNLAKPSEAKAMHKELVMQAKTPGHVVERAQAVFIDNSCVYIHIPRGECNFATMLSDERFTNTATSLVLFIRQMTRAVHDLHANGIIHGNIRPSAWLVTESGLAKIHGFDAARIPSQALKGQDYVSIHDEEKKFRASDHGKQATFESDVYGLGMCIKEITGASSDALHNAGLWDIVKQVVNRTTNDDASRRISARDAFTMTDDLFGKLRGALDSVKKQKEELKAVEAQLEKMKVDLERAAEAAETDLTKVANVVQDVRKQETALYTKQKRLQEDARALMLRQNAGDNLKPPPYWIGKSLDQMVTINPIDKNGALFQVFRHLIKTDHPKSLNQGRDVVERGNYTFMDLVGVWRVENSLLWQNYATERSNLRTLLLERHVKCPRVQLRETFEKAMNHLPGAAMLYKDLNEVYLLHGTKADVILSITTYGINERFTSVALFGKGSYFAEDSAKNDQYTFGDGTLGAHPELHRRLFPAGGCYRFPEFPYKAYYLILCRVVLGYPVRVRCTNSKKKEIYNIDHKNAVIFATPDQRELGPIPGIDNPPIFYHSLVAERGGVIARFREMVQFHSARIYPEYLIAYSRK